MDEYIPLPERDLDKPFLLRSELLDRLEQHLFQASRERHNGALLFIDLDRFKEVNDVFGQQIGDALLRRVANALQDAAGGAVIWRSRELRLDHEHGGPVESVSELDRTFNAFSWHNSRWLKEQKFVRLQPQ